MVKNKLSRINDMNYNYKLKLKNYPSKSYPSSLIPQDEVLEYWDLILVQSWSIDVLKYISIEAIYKETKKSFLRTQKWLQENHPEYLI